MNVGIIANHSRPNAMSVFAMVEQAAKMQGFSLFADPETAAKMESASAVELWDMKDHVDVLLAMGGDGTVLLCAEVLAGAEIPIMGINLGSLGFLTGVADDEVEQAFEALKAGSVLRSQRSIMDCSLTSTDGCSITRRALNDAVIAWGGTSHIVTLAVRIDGKEVAQFMCDGIIVSTPTGSTGHSLSAGGPILHPEAPVLQINVICPHTLSSRPLVLPDSQLIEIEILKTRKPLVCSVDGRDISDKVTVGTVLRVQKAMQSVEFLSLKTHNYFNTLNQKMHWRGNNLV